MELEEISRRIADQARELRSHIDDLRSTNIAQHTTQPTGSTESALSRIEDRLIKVHTNTNTLIARVPENLKPLLLEVKSAVFERIDSLKGQATKSTGSNRSIESDSHGNDWRRELFRKLTPRERNLFTACFGSGLITYKELAERLNIAPVSAKNMVNRLFLNAEKRKFFKKTRFRGVAKIGLTEGVEQRVLRNKRNSGNRKNPRFVFEK